MSIEKYDEYFVVNMKSVRNLLKNEVPGVQVLYDVLCEEMCFYTFRQARGQFVSIAVDAQKKMFEKESGLAWRTIRRYLTILIKKGLIRKKGEDILQINPEFAYKGEGSQRAAACRQWYDTA